MPIIYDIEKDILYQRGYKKGLQIARAKREEESKIYKAKIEAENDSYIINLYKSQVPIKTIIIGLKASGISQYRVRKVIKEWKAKSSKN